MADNARTNKHTSPESPDVETLREQARQARATGDTARAAQLDEQVRQAEADDE